MLLTRTSLTSLGSAASSFRARDSFVRSRPRTVTMKKSQEARAAASEGWLETAASKLEAVGGFFDKKLNGSGQPSLGPDQVLYKGTITVMKKLQVLDLIDRGADLVDDFSEVALRKRITFQLVSAVTDPSTGKALKSEEVPIEKWVATLETLAAQNLRYAIQFVVPKNFGVPGAVIVKNNHHNEFLLVAFVLDLPDKAAAHFITNSWVYNTSKTKGRIFFRNKAYLPADTPESLKELRAEELANLRGDGTGERKAGERIYDYATYNDLGNPDKDKKLDRPVLGGSALLPYPRRMRTGRKHSKKNKDTESQDNEDFYIPRDEYFDRIKSSDFKADGVRSVVHGVVSQARVKLRIKTEFNTVEEIKELFVKNSSAGLNNVLPDAEDIEPEEQFPLVFLKEVIKPDGKLNTPHLYPVPRLLQHDGHAWIKNDEFAREFLAGLNPVVISLVKEFPIKSTLKEFGYPVSAITAKHIEGKLEDLSVEQAVENKKLFVADYHDSYLPFIERINQQENVRSYATRALFFLSKDQTLKVLALELALPPKTAGGKLNARVFLPPTDTSKPDYLWEMAKAHVSNNDITAHQVFSHFSRCHAVTEAAIIASNRTLSKIHPIMQLMAPHFKCTLEINRAARKGLINAGGSIETHFTPRAYSLEMGAVNYRDTWTWPSQALPNDLVARGMAVPDPSSKHGVKLVIEDYPYAADGLELWTAIKGWNKEYVDLWYADDSVVQKDVELQAWFKELREEGHADKKDDPNWPVLDSKESLVDILTTMQWIPSCQHAAVNFGQFDYAGFMPHHPTIVRRLIPEEGTKEWAEMMKNPEKAYLLCLANVDSTTTAMTVYEVLSAHSPREEYIGERAHDWTEHEPSVAAFQRFSEKIADVDKLIKSRNADKSLKNRYGVVNVPYQLLYSKSRSGVTSMGVPNSITI